LSSIRCFKAYDLRGRIPDELNEDVAYRVGRGYAEFVAPKRVVVGRDIRLSSPGLAAALCRGLNDAGVDVDDIGVCGTEGVYFATFNGGYDGGIMVTASHNPPDYNGFKMVLRGAAIYGDQILALHQRIVDDNFSAPSQDESTSTSASASSLSDGYGYQQSSTETTEPTPDQGKPIGGGGVPCVN